MFIQYILDTKDEEIQENGNKNFSILSTVLAKWNRSLLQNIQGGDGSGKMWFAQHSLPYGTDNEAIELDVVPFQEYKEFINNTKIERYKSRSECDTLYPMDTSV